MKPLTLSFGIALVLALSAFTFLQSVTWQADENYKVVMGDATFRGLSAIISFDEAHPERSRIVASIDAKTYNAGNGVKNAHAREKEGLYTDMYPLITFASTAVKKLSGTAQYEATGKLTIKGITKEITLPFTFDSKNNVMDRFPMVPKQTFYGKMIINPKDFNITREGVPPTVFVELTVPVKSR